MIRLRAGTLLLALLCLSASQAAPPTVTLALLGDLMVGRAVHPQPASLASLVAELKGADLSLANLESPLAQGDGTVASTDGYNLCANSSRASLFPAWGLDMLLAGQQSPPGLRPGRHP